MGRETKRESMKKIGVIIETQAGAAKAAVFGLLTAAAGGEGEVIALLLDEPQPDTAERLAAYGASKIAAIDTKAGPLANRADQRAEAVVEAMAHFGIDALMGLSSAEGRELLPRIAAALDAPLAMDCIRVDPDAATAVKLHYSGKVLATVQLHGPTPVWGLRPNMVDPVKRPAAGETVSFQIAVAEGPGEWHGDAAGRSDGVDLTEAEIIISGGRGIKAGENFDILHACAREMGAAVGASRAAVDSGFAPYRMQVGQTGKTVSPKLYIACGISGAVQHFAGMKTAGTIVAINSDPKAPIFQNSDYYIVGDLFEVVPLLTLRLRAEREN
jgi:electron transfer flavoprotein alpha subunit